MSRGRLFYKIEGQEQDSRGRLSYIDPLKLKISSWQVFVKW